MIDHLLEKIVGVEIEMTAMTAMKYITLITLMFISPQIAWCANQYSEEYRFGVFPYLSAVRMDNLYSPICSELSQSLDHKVKFLTASTHRIFLDKLSAEYYDLALIQPFWYPTAVDETGYIPLLRMEEPFVSLIVVLDSSSIRTVDDLKGKIIATPPPFVPVVHLATHALFEQGIVPGKDVTLESYRTVDSCLQQLLIGTASACVTPLFVPAIFEETMNVKFRTILKSSSIPNMALIIHPRVTEVDRNNIRKTILSWSDTDRGKKLLKRIQTKRFVPIVNSEYDVVREFIKATKFNELNHSEH